MKIRIICLVFLVLSSRALKNGLGEPGNENGDLQGVQTKNTATSNANPDVQTQKLEVNKDNLVVGEIKNEVQAPVTLNDPSVTHEKTDPQLLQPGKPLQQTTDGQKKIDEEKIESKYSSNRIFAYIVQVVLALTGIYVCLFGFRHFRILMIILGFYTSYYLTLFFLSEFEIYKGENVGHQIGLFFGALVLGFVIAILCYFYDSINFFIFGLSVGCMISLFYAQFFVDFEIFQDRMILLGILIGTSCFISLGAYYILDQATIFGSALVGSIIAPINIGVLCGDFKSFEDREKLPLDRFKDFYAYLLICGVMLITGIGCQFYLRRRIFSKMADENLNQIRGDSFLN